MPFVFVHGIPSGTSADQLLALRRSIVQSVSESMRHDEVLDRPLAPHLIRPFFVPDLLEGLLEEADGAKTIYARLDTTMFGSLPHYAALPTKVAERLAQVIWNAFEGAYKVEVFVGELHPGWEKHLPARPER